MRMLLTGEPITGQELHRLGVVHWVRETPEQADAEALRVAARVAAMPPRAVAACKRGILQTWDLGLGGCTAARGIHLQLDDAPGHAARMRSVQSRYDEGDDSWAAFEHLIARSRRPGYTVT